MDRSLDADGGWRTRLSDPGPVCSLSPLPGVRAMLNVQWESSAETTLGEERCRVAGCEVGGRLLVRRVAIAARADGRGILRAVRRLVARVHRPRIMLHLVLEPPLAGRLVLFAEVLVGLCDLGLVAVALVRVVALVGFGGRRVLVVAVVRRELGDLLLFDVVRLVADEVSLGVVLLVRVDVLAHRDALVGLHLLQRRSGSLLLLLLDDRDLLRQRSLLFLLLRLLLLLVFLLGERLLLLLLVGLHLGRRWSGLGSGVRLHVVERDFDRAVTLVDLVADVIGEREEGLVVVVSDPDLPSRHTEPKMDPGRDASPQERHQRKRNCTLAVAKHYTATLASTIPAVDHQRGHSRLGCAEPCHDQVLRVGTSACASQTDCDANIRRNTGTVRERSTLAIGDLIPTPLHVKTIPR